jgi:hypothetical protein
MRSSRSLAAFRDGWRRVAAAPAIAAGVFAMTFILALPLALVLRDSIATHLRDSLIAARVADGANWDWWQELSAQATGLGTTLTPSVIGAATTLDSVSRVLDGRAPIAPVAWTLVFYLAGWLFVSGGIIDRYARQRPTRAYGFFAAAGTFFFRFLRLGAFVGVVYWWLFAYVHPWLFDQQYETLTRNVSVERTAFAWRVTLYAAFGVLLLFVSLLADYAKVRIVVEDRRSAAGALAAAWRFIRRHPRRVITLYGLNALSFIALVGIWVVVSPGAGGGGAAMWAAFAATQCYVLARLLLKLQFVASETALFQAALAHASYTTAPEPIWPDSAAAEAITRTVRLPDQQSPSA